MHALAPILVALATATGSAEVELWPRLWVDHALVEPSGAAFRGSVLASSGWRVADGGSSAQTEISGRTYGARVVLSARPGDPGAELRVTMTYRRNVRVRRETLALELPVAMVRAVWRDLRLRVVAPGGLLRVDRWTPKVAVITLRPSATSGLRGGGGGAGPGAGGGSAGPDAGGSAGPGAGGGSAGPGAGGGSAGPGAGAGRAAPGAHGEGGLSGSPRLVLDGSGLEGMTVAVARGGRGSGQRVTITLVLDDVRGRPWAVFPGCVAGAVSRQQAARGEGAVSGQQAARGEEAVSRQRAAREEEAASGQQAARGERGASGQEPPPSLRRRRGVGARVRRAGERVSYRVRLYLADEAPPVLVGRWPHGRRAALVFKDHADQTTASTLRALLYGTSDRKSPRYGKGGFLGHGLPITKALFWRGSRRSRHLADPEVAALARALVAAGGEVALHSPTPWADRRAVVKEALQAVAAYGVSTWVDHRPATNCEAITALGGGARGSWARTAEGGAQGPRPRREPAQMPYFVADLLAAAGYLHVWSGEEYPGTGLNLLSPDRGAAETPFLYPWHPPGARSREEEAARAQVYLFRSVWAFKSRRSLLKLLSPANLDRLQAEHGVAVLHTYLEMLRGGRARGGHAPGRPARPLSRGGHRSLLRVVGAGRRAAHVETRPELEGLLDDLAQRQRRRDLWVTTVRDLGRHLRSVAGVTVRYRGDGGAVVENAQGHWIRGLTLYLPTTDSARLGRGGGAGAPGTAWRLVAAGAAGGRVETDALAAWLDLPPGGRTVVRVHDGTGKVVPLVRPVRFSFRQRERRSGP